MISGDQSETEFLSSRYSIVRYFLLFRIAFVVILFSLHLIVLCYWKFEGIFVQIRK